MRRRVFFLASLAGCAVACTNPDASLKIVTVAPPPGTTIRFSADVQPIFTRSCAFLGCHAGTSPAQGLNLESGNAYGNLVNVQSAEIADVVRVNPGMSAASYLVRKLEGTSIVGERMPFGGPYLPDAEIQVIRDWIDQGADNN